MKKVVAESFGTVTGNLKEGKGITLIALVITIIVLLILAGVTVISLTGDNGILNKSKTAKDMWNKGQEKEAIELAVLNSQISEEGTNFSINKEKLEQELKELGIEDKNIEKTIINDDNTAFPWTVTGKTGTKYIIDEKGNVEADIGVGALEIFDKENKDENKLHIGDFVNYDAGTWTQNEIDSIKVGKNDSLVTANGSTDLPTAGFQFGGFTAGISRNGNATPYNSKYNYIQEKISDGTTQAVTGWRVFDIGEDGSIELISAGCPEDFYHPSGIGYAGISEYILTGNIDSSDTSLDLEGNYTKRNWSIYVNQAQKAESATVLTFKRLEDWFEKNDKAAANDFLIMSFVYGQSGHYRGKYPTLIDYVAIYWLGSKYRNTNYLYFVQNEDMGSNYERAYGVRPLVSLESGVKLSKKRVGTKTVVSKGKEYNYNVWNIK